MKSEVKKQMLTLVIGILLGAIIATGVFLALKSGNSNNNGNFNDKPAITDGERSSGEKGSRSKDKSSDTKDKSSDTKDDKETTESSESTEKTK